MNAAKLRFYVRECPADGSWSIIDYYSIQPWSRGRRVPCACAHYRRDKRDLAIADANGRNALAN